ncbi:MAG TPA: NAD(P)H-dependent oxidoreductase [Bdellovibrio sp.]|uniref:NADPH-dependent FMN reductase n=1 Tax=Bdellovibrio sp. TaxID=28201 RepID=UPI002F19E9B5
MASKKILALVGGICKDSLNKKTYNMMKDLAPAGIELQTFDISKLPFFTQDEEQNPQPIVQDLKKLVIECDAVLFITPEYNRSFPGVLKNAIDWPSRPYGKNLWARKPAAVMGASGGAIGTFGAQHHLRQVLAYLDMKVMGQPEFYFNAGKAFGPDGKCHDESNLKFASQFWKAFVDFIDSSTAKTAESPSKTKQSDSPQATV